MLSPSTVDAFISCNDFAPDKELFRLPAASLLSLRSDSCVSSALSECVECCECAEASDMLLSEPDLAITFGVKTRKK